MRHRTFLILLGILCLSMALSAQDTPAITVDTLTVCTAVEERQPVGADTLFSADVGRLFCFTKLSGPADTSNIAHVWFFGDKQMAKVDLTMKAKSWRTWSSKNIVSDWTGAWRIEVWDASGQVLATKAFKVQ